MPPYPLHPTPYPLPPTPSDTRLLADGEIVLNIYNVE